MSVYVDVVGVRPRCDSAERPQDTTELCVSAQSCNRYFQPSPVDDSEAVHLCMSGSYDGGSEQPAPRALGPQVRNLPPNHHVVCRTFNSNFLPMRLLV